MHVWRYAVESRIQCPVQFLVLPVPVTQSALRESRYTRSRDTTTWPSAKYFDRFRIDHIDSNCYTTKFITCWTISAKLDMMSGCAVHHITLHLDYIMHSWCKQTDPYIKSWCCATSTNQVPCSFTWTNCMHKFYILFIVLMFSNLFCDVFNIQSSEWFCNWANNVFSNWWITLNSWNTLLSVAKNAFLNNCSKTTHDALSYLFNCFIDCLLYYSFKILSTKPQGCSLFLFA